METKFEISMEIYPENIILDAIDDFSDVAVFSFNNGKINISGESEIDNTHIFNEFMNYVIGLINQ